MPVLQSKGYDPDSCYNLWLARLNLPLLPHSQTLSSFLKHIHHYNYSQLNNFNHVLTISIKLDYSECYIHLPCKSELLPEYFFPRTSGYTYYPSIPIPSKFSLKNNNILNTNLIIKESEIDYTYFDLVGTILDGHDETTIAKQYYDNIQPNTCYNKFLFYNHLPPLTHPQTIISFLRHIDSFGYSPNNCYNYTLTISIKNDHSEAHVYLPFEAKLLPNHFILPIQAIWHYPNIQLKSNSPTPTFSIPAPLVSISSNLSQPNISNNSSLNLTICTHNV